MIGLGIRPILGMMWYTFERRHEVDWGDIGYLGQAIASVTV